MAPVPLVAVEAPAPLVAVEAHLNSQEVHLVVVMPLIFPRAAQVSQDKTLQVAPLPCPTHLDQPRASSLVEAHHRHRSLEDPDPAMLLQLYLLVFHQGGMDLSLHRQEAPHLGHEAPHLGHEQASPGLLLHPPTAVDLLSRQLLEGGPHFLMTGLHHHQLLWAVIDHLCPVISPLLLLLLSTPNRPPLSLPPLVLPLVEVHHLSHQADRDLLLSHPARLEVMITALLVYPKGTAHLTGRLLVKFDLFYVDRCLAVRRDVYTFPVRHQIMRERSGLLNLSWWLC